MGYYTNFELSVLEGTADMNAVHKALRVIMHFDYEDDFNIYMPVEDNTIRSGDSMKWYDHDEDCATLSKVFPGVVFKLHGEGEETGDIWNSYYKDGQCQICRAKFVYPEYDEKKLKSVQAAQREDSGRQ